MRIAKLKGSPKLITLLPMAEVAAVVSAALNPSKRAIDLAV